MNRNNLRRLAILGRLPLDPKYLKKQIRLSKERKLERDGWVKNGEGFADAQMLIGVYRSYFRDESVDVPKEAAMPHYPVFSGNPDYWMYGRLIKRTYLHYYMVGDRIENRGVSFHSTEGTKTFRHEKLQWDGADSGLWAD